MPMLYRQAETGVEKESSYCKSSKAGMCCGVSDCFSALWVCMVSKMMFLAGQGYFFFFVCVSHYQGPRPHFPRSFLISHLQEISDFINSKVRFGVKFNHLQNNTTKIKRHLAEILWETNGA